MKLIYSRYVNENRKFMYETIKNKLDKNETVYLMVPEQFTLGTEIDIYNYLGINSTFNLRIKSFKTIANEVINKTSGRAENYVNDSAKFLLVQLVLYNLQEELKIFNKNIYDGEFVNLLVSFIEEISSNKVEISLIEDILDDENKSEELKGKLKDLLLVIKKYSEILNESNYSSINRFDLIIENIKHINEFRNINFFFYRFHDMSVKELEVLSQIDKISKNTYLNLTLDANLIKDDLNLDNPMIEDSDVFEISKKFLKSIKKHVNKIETIEVVPEKKEKLNEFYKSLFSYNLNNVKNKFKEKDKKFKNIFIYRLNNTSDEVENLARNIKKDIVNKGYKFRDIAILVTNTSEYYSKIKQVFSINDIHYFIDQNRNISDNYLIKYIKSSLYILESGLNTQSIVQYLKMSFAPFTTEEINVFQTYIEKRKIRGKMLFNDKYFTPNKNSKYYEKEDKKNLEVILKIRNYIEQIFLEIKDEKLYLTNEYISDIKNFTEEFYRFIANKNFMKNFYNYIKKSSNQEKQENLSIWDEFIKLIDDLMLIENQQLDLIKYVNLLESVINNFSVGIIPPSQDQVIIGDFKRSRFTKVKKLYVLGMSNLYYPENNIISDLFLEEEKNDLIQSGIEIKNTLANNFNNDILSFYELLHVAQNEIEFSYSMINSSNESMDKAFIINWIESMIEKDNIIYPNLFDESVVYSKSLMSIYMPKQLKNKNLDDLEKLYIEKLIEIIRNLGQNIDYSIILNSIDTKIKSIRNIRNDLIDKIFNLNKFNVSQLEAFNQNPYDHFIKYGLKPREYPEYNLSAMDRGNISHGVISDFVKFRTKNIDEIFEKNLENIIEEYKLNDDKNIFFINKLKNNLNSYLKLIDVQMKESNIYKVYTEQRYGENSEFTSIKIRENDDSYINIEGFIDRIDEFKKDDNYYYRVIDYKTGSKDFSIGKVYTGIDLQLILYLYAAIQKNKNSKPVGAFYQYINQEISVDAMDNALEEKLDGSKYKDFKLDGVLNSDIEVLKLAEPSFNPSDIKKSYNFVFKTSGKKLDKADNILNQSLFEKLFEHVKNEVKNTVYKIKNGNIELYPFKLNNFSPYEYSNYKTIHREENIKYRYLDKYDWDTVKEELEKDG